MPILTKQTNFTSYTNYTLLIILNLFILLTYYTNNVDSINKYTRGVPRDSGARPRGDGALDRAVRQLGAVYRAAAAVAGATVRAAAGGSEGGCGRGGHPWRGEQPPCVAGGPDGRTEGVARRRAGAAGAAGGRRGWRASVCGAPGAAGGVWPCPAAGATGWRCQRQAWQAGGTAPRAFSRLCRATDQDTSLPHQDRWRGRPCHVTGQRPGHRHVIPLAAPPCMAWYRRFTALRK